MLKEILSITGKPGLFKIVNHSGKTLIVEELTSGKRFPVSPRDRIVALGDIAMYTESDDKPLGEILDAVYANEDGKKIDVKGVIAGEGLKAKFAEIVPDFDRDRVHDSDIKKLFTWYNLLLDNGFTKFTEEVEETKEEDSKEEDPKEETKKDSKEESTKKSK